MVFGEVSSPSLCPLGIAHVDVGLQPLSPVSCMSSWSPSCQQVMGKKSVMGVCKPSQRNHVAWLSLAADHSFYHCSVMVIQYKNAPKLCFLTATELLSYSSSAALGVKPVLWSEICKHSAPSVYISKGKWHFINTELCYSQHLIFYIGFISQIYWLSWEDWNVNLTSLAVL